MRLIEGYGAGGTPDLVSRLIGNWLMLVAAAKSRRMASKAVPTRRRAS